MAGVQSIPPEAQLAVPPAVVAEVKPCEGAQTLARVGNDLILASEVVPLVDETIAQLPESERAQIPDWQLEEERRALIMKLLRQQIEVKLVYQDARRNLPAERLEHIDKRLGEIFDKEELPKRIKKANVKSARELDERLQSVGTSLDRQKRAFVERMLAMQWMHEQNDFDEDVAHEEMVDYYWQHLDEFETPARALWEELSVCIPRYSDGAEAYAKLARLGNQVLDGAPMAEVLKAQPKECPECRGGSKGWITRGSAGLSEVLEEAIFGLPVGRPSRILRDRDGFHVVRVIQREDFQRTLFAEADQNEICEKIRRLRRQEQIQQYLFRLRQEITVSTVFDDDPAFAERPRASKPQRR